MLLVSGCLLAMKWGVRHFLSPHPFCHGHLLAIPGATEMAIPSVREKSFVCILLLHFTKSLCFAFFKKFSCILSWILNILLCDPFFYISSEHYHLCMTVFFCNYPVGLKSLHCSSTAKTSVSEVPDNGIHKLVLV